MAIVKRSDKGSALTHAELDGNFTDLDGRASSADAALATKAPLSHTHAAAQLSDSSAVGRQILTAADAAAVRAAALSAARTQSEAAISANLLGAVSNGAYALVVHAPHAGTITETTTQCASGSGTLTVTINGTPLGGGANAVGTTKQTRPHASANTFAVGDSIAMSVSGSAALTNASLTIKYTRTLQ